MSWIVSRKPSASCVRGSHRKHSIHNPVLGPSRLRRNLATRCARSRNVRSRCCTFRHGECFGSDGDDDRLWATPFHGRGYRSDTGSRGKAREESALEENDVGMMSTNGSRYSDGEGQAERYLSPDSSRHNEGDGAKKEYPSCGS